MASDPRSLRPTCGPGDHAPTLPRVLPPGEDLVRAADIFRAMGDPERLRLLVRLAAGEVCVTDLAAAEGVRMTTLSARLQALFRAGLVRRRRAAKHVYYALADGHVGDLVANAIRHASDCRDLPLDSVNPQETAMSTCTLPHHGDHPHRHGPGCGHTAVRHGDHVDYLHDGHLHHMHDGHVDEHRIEVSATNPDRCTPDHRCASHGADHVHGPGCGHEAVPHGDHVDYLVDGHLHHPHGDHCDDHGPLPRA